jgi:hypothetical protein
MTFMMRLSLTNSPDSYIIYKALGYFFIGLAACLLVRFIRRHPLISYRLGILAVCLQIVAIAVLYQYTEIYPYVLAIFTGIEATLFWRPHNYFCCTEVTNRRRLRFESLGLIWGSILKISLPVILGLIIAETDFINSAVVVLVISLVQLFISLLFRPTKAVNTKVRPLLTVWRSYLGKGIFGRLILLQLRGFFSSGSAYSIVPIFLIYNALGSDFSLGFYTSVGAAIAIGLTLAFGGFKKGRRAVLVGLTLLLAVAPLLLMADMNMALLVGFYIISIAVAGKLLNMVATVSINNILHGVNRGDLIEIDVFNEVVLNIFRMIGLFGLLIVIQLFGMGHSTLLLVAASLAFMAVAVAISCRLPKISLKH